MIKMHYVSGLLITQSQADLEVIFHKYAFAQKLFVCNQDQYKETRVHFKHNHPLLNCENDTMLSDNITLFYFNIC